MSYNELKHSDNAVDEETTIPQLEDPYSDREEYVTGEAIIKNVGRWSNIYRPISRFEWQCMLCLPGRVTNIRFDKTSKTNLARHVKRKHPSSYKQYFLYCKDKRMEDKVGKNSREIVQHKRYLELYGNDKDEEYPADGEKYQDPGKLKETKLNLSEYFKSSGEFEMQCMVCLKEEKITYIKWCKSSKTNLTRHLRRRHQQV